MTTQKKEQKWLRVLLVGSMALAVGWVGFVVGNRSDTPALILGALPFLMLGRYAWRALNRAGGAPEDGRAPENGEAPDGEGAQP